MPTDSSLVADVGLDRHIIGGLVTDPWGVGIDAEAKLRMQATVQKCFPVCRCHFLF
jgi:hypothetical protein